MERETVEMGRAVLNSGREYGLHVAGTKSKWHDNMSAVGCFLRVQSLLAFRTVLQTKTTKYQFRQQYGGVSNCR